jgi:hypothetical protein
MTRNRLEKVRHLALLMVLGNLVLVGLLGSVLPEAALAALPVLAIMLPLLSAAAIEAALSHTGRNKPATAARPARLHLGRPLHHAA